MLVSTLAVPVRGARSGPTSQAAGDATAPLTMQAAGGTTAKLTVPAAKGTSAGFTIQAAEGTTAKLTVPAAKGTSAGFTIKAAEGTTVKLTGPAAGDTKLVRSSPALNPFLSSIDVRLPMENVVNTSPTGKEGKKLLVKVRNNSC